MRSAVAKVGARCAREVGEVGQEEGLAGESMASVGRELAANTLECWRPLGKSNVFVGVPRFILNRARYYLCALCSTRAIL